MKKKRTLTTLKADTEKINAALKGRGLDCPRQKDNRIAHTQREGIHRRLGHKVKHLFALGLEEL